MELELHKDFKELLESFNRNEVKYLLIGGYAVGLHGYVRATNDIDIAVADDADNALKIVAALREFGFTDGIYPELFTQKDSLVVMGVEPVAVDILNYLKGTDFDSAYAARKLVCVEDIEISVISLPHLLANKTGVGRLKDMVDVEELQKRKPS